MALAQAYTEKYLVRKNQLGASAIEFAIVLPLLMLVLDGVTEFSLLLYDKVILTNAAREAARTGIIIKAPKLTNAEISQVAQDYCRNFLISFGASESTLVTINQTFDPVYQSPLTVSVSFKYKSLLISSIITSIKSPIILTSTVTLLNE